jgi:hypothetical protein
MLVRVVSWLALLARSDAATHDEQQPNPQPA